MIGWPEGRHRHVAPDAPVTLDSERSEESDGIANLTTAPMVMDSCSDRLARADIRFAERPHRGAGHGLAFRLALQQQPRFADGKSQRCVKRNRAGVEGILYQPNARRPSR